jgi:hypothetical protein
MTRRHISIQTFVTISTQRFLANGLDVYLLVLLAPPNSLDLTPVLAAAAHHTSGK